jgi:UDP-glucuronate decarboxylase
LPAAPRNAKVCVESIAMDDWLEFLGYYLSEGCVHVRQRTQTVNGREYQTQAHNILIAQEKPYGRFKIAACMSQLGFRFYDSDHHQFRIQSVQLAQVLAPLGKSHQRYIPREYMNLSVRQSRILFDALMLGDGTPKGNGYAYYSKSKQLADDVQELALRCGFASSVRLQESRDLYRVNIRVPVEANLAPPVSVPYNDNVYCVNVRHHVICWGAKSCVIFVIPMACCWRRRVMRMREKRVNFAASGRECYSFNA